jgi:hypothetical protein
LDKGSVQEVSRGVILGLEEASTQAIWKLEKAPSLACKECLVEKSKITETNTTV